MERGPVIAGFDGPKAAAATRIQTRAHPDCVALHRKKRESLAESLEVGRYEAMTTASIPSKTASRSWRIVGGLLVILCGVPAATRLLMEGWSATAADEGDYDTALRYRAGNVEALSGSAHAATMAGNGAEAKRLALLALDRDPLDVASLRELALGEEALGHTALAGRMMDQAGRLSWRDTPSQVWLFSRAVRTGDINAITLRGDALLRRKKLPDTVMPVLQALTLRPEGRTILAAHLRDWPYWRINFLQSLDPVDDLHASNMITMFDTLDETDAPANEAESSSFIRRLINAGYGWAAGQLWSRIDHTNKSALGDPDGQGIATDRTAAAYRSPFRWQGGTSAEGQVAAGTSADGKQAIEVQAGSGSFLRFAYRYVALAPGDHRLQYSVSGVPDGASDRISAAITCVDSAAGHYVDLPQQAMNSTHEGGWVTIRTGFTVPDDCEAQLLSLSLATRDEDRNVDLFVRQIGLDAR